jgi:hypothetical protein
VRAWKASGLSCAQFAGRAGIHAGTLSWWRWKLAAEQSGRAAPGRERRRAQAPVSFVELAPEPNRAPEPKGEPIELAIGGVTLRVPARFEAQTLARVLDVLEARR